MKSFSREVAMQTHENDPRKIHKRLKRLKKIKRKIRRRSEDESKSN